MSNTPITDKIIKDATCWDESVDFDAIESSIKKLELAANKLHSRLSIWVNTANAAVRGYSNMEDIEALADFELLRRP